MLYTHVIIMHFEHCSEHGISSGVPGPMSCNSLLEETWFKIRSSLVQNLVLSFRRKFHIWNWFSTDQAKEDYCYLGKPGRRRVKSQWQHKQTPLKAGVNQTKHFILHQFFNFVKISGLHLGKNVSCHQKNFLPYLLFQIEFLNWLFKFLRSHVGYFVCCNS